MGQPLAFSPQERAGCPLKIINAKRHALIISEVEFRKVNSLRYHPTFLTP